MKKWMMAAMTAMLAVPCYADTSAMDQDVTCLVALALLPDLNKQTHRIDETLAEQSSLIGTMYFVGKITGRDATYDVESAVIRLANSMDNAAIGSALIRCGTEMQTQGGKWETIGKHLMEKGKASTP